MRAETDVPTTPAANLKPDKMPGHWLLARMGKRVLRPGGLELTRQLLDALNVSPADDVVEFAPGMGITARMTLVRLPRSYTAVERDEDAARIVRGYLSPQAADASRGVSNQRCVTGDASATGLPDGCASVVYGEAMLTMQPHPEKERIIREAVRLLRPGGRYGIHEMVLTPDDIARETVDALTKDLSHVIHHGFRPLTAAEWRKLFESCGLRIVRTANAPMHLLEPARIVRDEGLGRAIRFAWNVLTMPEARHRVLTMKRAFRKFSDNISAIMILAEKLP